MMRSLIVAGALAAALLLSSCTSGPVVPPIPSPSPPPAASGDGVLRLGTLFPTTGPISYISPAQEAGVELAVREINEAGGVLGAPVEVFHRNSGEAESQVAEASFAELVAKGVDVIIGPSSSVLAERILPLAVATPVLMISPAASSVVLSDLDDTGGLAQGGYLARTIAPASMRGAVLAEAITADGPAKIAVVAFDDANGVAALASLEAALADTKSSVTARQNFDAATTDFAPVVAALTKAAPDAVVLLSPFSAMAQNAALVTALAAAGLAGPKLWLTGGSMADYSQALPDGMLAGSHGVLEGAEPDEAFRARVTAMNPAIGNFRYAAEAYDATILAALAAVVAKDDGAPLLAHTLASISEGGIKCLSFGECLDVLRTQSDIDYDGVSGPISLDGRGDPSAAHFGVYSYAADNRFTRVGDVLAQ